MTDHLTDVEFIAYCERHSRSDEALFTGAEIKRIAALAGRRIQPILDHGFYPCHLFMREMCADARALIVGCEVLAVMVVMVVRP